jgi:uncharacterized repeat protein (TIGR01451 family)
MTLKNLTVTGGIGYPAAGSRIGASLTNGDGGGIGNAGTLNLDHVAVRGNHANTGGGIGGTGDSTIVDSEISGNLAVNGGGGGIEQHDVSITDSTVSGNEADTTSATAPVGAGILVSNHVDGLNDTIAGNDVFLRQSTASQQGAIHFGAAFLGAAVARPGDSTALFTNTIMANNTVHETNVQASQNCNQSMGSGGDNVTDDTSCGFTGTGDLVQDPKLAALGDNGGQTQTMAIGNDSPAYNHVTDNACPPPSHDQRDVSRPQFAVCDSGAFELAATTADLSETKTVSPASVTVGQNVTYTLTSSNAGPTAATNTVVTDTLPAGVAFVSASPSQGSCAGTTTITCSLGTVAAGGHATITIVVRVTSVGQFTNSANVTADPADPNTANNRATAVVTGLAPAATSCLDTRKFTFKLHKFRKARIVDVVVFINGHRKAHKKGHNLKKVTISKLPLQVFTVKIVSRQSTGSKLISVRHYNGCIKSRPRTTGQHVHPHH